MLRRHKVSLLWRGWLLLTGCRQAAAKEEEEEEGAGVEEEEPEFEHAVKKPRDIAKKMKARARCFHLHCSSLPAASDANLLSCRP